VSMTAQLLRGLAVDPSSLPLPPPAR